MIVALREANMRIETKHFQEEQFSLHVSLPESILSCINIEKLVLYSIRYGIVASTPPCSSTRFAKAMQATAVHWGPAAEHWEVGRWWFPKGAPKGES